MPENFSKLKEMMNLLNEGLTKTQFLNAFKDVLKAVSAIEKKLSEITDSRLSNAEKQVKETVTVAKSEIEKVIRETRSANESTLASLKLRSIESINTLFDKMRLNERFDEIMEKCDDKMGEMDSKMESIPSKEEFVALIPKAKEETPVQLRDKLETLKEEERLDKSAIRGIDDLEKQIKEAKNVRIVGGRSPLQLYVDGTKRGAAQYLNLIAGTGITLSYSQASGRNDITITATGTASITPIAVTGTINDSNLSFTATSAPSLVIVNGKAFRDGKGCSISGTAITLDFPVGVGGDIYAL